MVFPFVFNLQKTSKLLIFNLHKIENQLHCLIEMILAYNLYGYENYIDADKKNYINWFDRSLRYLARSFENYAFIRFINNKIQMRWFLN